jgi:hypothetical protein
LDLLSPPQRAAFDVYQALVIEYEALKKRLAENNREQYELQSLKLAHGREELV